MQRINLYNPPPAPEKPKLPLSQMLLIILVISLYFSFNAFMQFLSLNKQTEEIKKLEIGKQNVARNLRLLRANLPEGAAEEQELAKKAENLGKIKTLRERMFSELNKLQIEDKPGFVHYFYAISKLDVPGIWLTKFDFLNGGDTISLEGRTENAGLIPLLVAKIGSDDAFRGKKFESLKITKAPDDEGEGLIKFTLRSD